MINEDDCIYQRNYAEYIVEKMERESNLVITSSDFENAKVPSSAPEGSGRFIKNSCLKSLGNRFPPYYDSESWMLEKALQQGYRMGCFPETKYKHFRELGSKHQFRHWEAAMVCLGYHLLWVLYRCFKYVHTHLLSLKSLVMLWHYFIPINRKNDPYFTLFEKDLRQYVWKKQGRRVITLMRSVIR